MNIKEDEINILKSKKYYGVKLTPQIFKNLMLEEFDGKRFKRRDAVRIIGGIFVEMGGSMDGVDGVSVFKKASAYLRNSGLTNVSYGTWDLNYHNKTTILVESKNSKKIMFNTEVGKGKESVYMYYFDTYRKLALIEKKHRWPCKIGMTVNDPYRRVWDQKATAFPELPIFALLIHTSDAAKCEKAIHAILEEWNMKLDSPGNEWYSTNTDEILKAFEFLNRGNNEILE